MVKISLSASLKLIFASYSLVVFIMASKPKIPPHVCMYLMSVLHGACLVVLGHPAQTIVLCILSFFSYTNVRSTFSRSRSGTLSFSICLSVCVFSFFKRQGTLIHGGRRALNIHLFVCVLSLFRLTLFYPRALYRGIRTSRHLDPW